MLRFLLLCLTFALGPAALAQSTTLSGITTDPTGAPIPSVRITATTTDGVSLAHTTSAPDGHFLLRNLPTGPLILLADPTSGFASTTLRATAPATDLRLTLPLAAVEQSVTVGNTVTTDPADNKDTIALSNNTLESLPTFDGDYLATLLPFLDQSSLGSGGAQITIDGVPANSNDIPPSAIQEIRINSDPYTAEYNRPGRARVDIITKQATSEFHGTVNILFRDSALNATNYFATTKPSEQRRIYEGSILGPLTHRFGFLLAANRYEEHVFTPVHAITPTGPDDSVVSTPSSSTNFAGRIGRDFSPNHSAYLHYHFGYDIAHDNNVGGITTASAGFSDIHPEHLLRVNDRLILTTNLVNTFGMLLQYEMEEFRSTTKNQPALIIPGTFIGGGAQADVYRTEDTMTLNEVLNYSHGRHYFRFGAQIPQLSYRSYNDNTNRQGTYTFSSLAAFNAGQATSFTVQQGTGHTNFWFNEIGAFVQDQIKLTKTLQASLGLRYDWQTYLNDLNNFSPRVSLAWAPKRVPNTVLRTGAGVFYDRSGGDPLGPITLHDGIKIHSYQFENTTYPFTGTIPTNAPQNLQRFAPDIRTPYQIQYSLAVERKLTTKSTLTVGYRGSVGIGLLRSRDINAPLAPTYTQRPDPTVGMNQYIESKGRQSVNALDINYTGALRTWFTGQAQYTLGRILNNTDGITFFAQNQSRPQDEYARATNDRRHRLNILGNLAPGKLYSIGFALTAYSGTPYTELLGTDPFGDALGNARPIGVPRNSLSKARNIALDLRYAYDWHLNKLKGEHARVLTFGLDAFNVLNRANLTTYSGTITSPLFTQPTAAGPARQLQLSARFKF